MLRYFAVLLCFIPLYVGAAPVVQGTSGTFSHGASVTITGTGFGTKAVAAPVRWDDFESGTLGNDLVGWNVTATNPLWRPKYAAVGRTGTAGSQSAWQHFEGGQYNSTILVRRTSKKFYISGWVSGNVSGPPSRNVKVVSFRGINLGFPKGRFDVYPTTNSGHKYIEGCTGNVIQQDWSVNGYVFDGAPWVRFEAWVDLGTANGNNGRYQTWKNTVEWGATRTGTFITTDCNFEEAYIQHYHATDNATGIVANYYWDELYVDVTRARVELGNASTWAASTHREIQVPSAWADGSITATINRGSFQPDQSVYLFVVDDAGVPSPGYAVTIGSGGTQPPADTTPPVISSLQPSGVQPAGTSSVTLQAATNEPATCKYGTSDVAYASLSNTFSTTGGTTHSNPGVSTAPNQSYTFYVRCMDAANNANTSSALIQFSTPSANDIVVDNDSSGVTSSGTWSASSYFPGYFGVNYRYSANVAGSWYQWPVVLQAGQYQVYVWWPTSTGRPTDVSYDIVHSGGTATVSGVSQNINGGQWNLLGTWTFGTTGSVRVISGATGTQGTVADAVRFVATAGDTTPPIVVSRVISASGTQFFVEFDEAVQFSGVAPTLSASGGAVIASNCSAATNVVTCSLSRIIMIGEIITATCSGSCATSFSDTSDNAMAAWSSQSVQNGSVRQPADPSFPAPTLILR
jgi:hypothetical protein